MLESGKLSFAASAHALTSPVCQPAGTSPILYFHCAAAGTGYTVENSAVLRPSSESKRARSTVSLSSSEKSASTYRKESAIHSSACDSSVTVYTSAGRHRYVCVVVSASCVVPAWMAYTSSFALLRMWKNSEVAALRYTRRRSTIVCAQLFTSSVKLPV